MNIHEHCPSIRPARTNWTWLLLILLWFNTFVLIALSQSSSLRQWAFDRVGHATGMRSIIEAISSPTFPLLFVVMFVSLVSGICLALKLTLGRAAAEHTHRLDPPQYVSLVAT